MHTPTVCMTHFSFYSEHATVIFTMSIVTNVQGWTRAIHSFGQVGGGGGGGGGDGQGAT